MSSQIYRLDLALRRRSLAGYAAGMAVYAFVIVALYPQFKHDISLNSLTKQAPTVMALLGVTGSLTSATGWLDVNIYANFLPLIALLATVSYGAGCLAGQDHDGTLASVVTLPVTRRRIVGEKVLALVTQAVVIVAVVVVCVLIGRAFGLSMDIGPLLQISVAVLLLVVDLGLVAMATGAATGSRGAGIGCAAAVAAASYLVSSLAPVVSWAHSIRFASLFYWSVANGQLVSGVSAASYAVLVGAGMVMAVLTVVAFSRLDLH